MTEETARFLLGLLQAQQLHVGAPDFSQAVDRVTEALAELTAIIDKSQRSHQ
jgi:hypothetical protein